MSQTRLVSWISLVGSPDPGTFLILFSNQDKFWLGKGKVLKTNQYFGEYLWTTKCIFLSILRLELVRLVKSINDPDLSHFVWWNSDSIRFKVRWLKLFTNKTISFFAHKNVLEKIFEQKSKQISSYVKRHVWKKNWNLYFLFIYIIYCVDTAGSPIWTLLCKLAKTIWKIYSQVCADDVAFLFPVKHKSHPFNIRVRVSIHVAKCARHVFLI